MNNLPIFAKLKSEPGWRATISIRFEGPMPVEADGQIEFGLLIKQITFWGFVGPSRTDHIGSIFGGVFGPCGPNVVPLIGDNGIQIEAPFRLHDILGPSEKSDEEIMSELRARVSGGSICV